MANEILASLQDINTHLPEDKAKMLDSSDDQLQVDAQRLIRAQLSGVFQPSTLASWVDPDDTPELIRGIAGRLIAGKWYATLYSEDELGVSSFAQSLYAEAITMLAEIRAGTLVVTDANGEPIETNLLDFTSGSFYPNDSAPGPFFTMEKEFG